MQRLHVVLPVAVFLALSCASGGQTSGRSTGSRNVITAEQLAGLTVEQNAYDAIRRLRSTWLRTRSVDAATVPVVFVDNVRAGDLERLRTIPLEIVAELRYISAMDATTRWGTGYTGGVIEVITRPQGRR